MTLQVRVCVCVCVCGLYGVEVLLTIGTCTPLTRMKCSRPQLQTMEKGEANLAWLPALVASLHLLPRISIFDACWRGLPVLLAGMDEAHVTHLAAYLDRAYTT